MITQDYLKTILEYDELTGLLTWKRSRSGVNVGDIAGYTAKSGYIQVGIDGKLHLAHRLVFLYVTGCCNGCVDHIDGNPTNNKFNNLRIVSHQENSKNAKKPKSNTSGYIGVSFDKVNNKWRSTIKVNRKQVHLGRFSCVDDAVTARKQAELQYNFHENHGR